MRPLSLLSLSLLLTSTALATGTPAGTVITNTATFDSEDGRVDSNPASLSVQAVCGLTLGQDGQTRTVQAGQGAYFGHLLTNTGNATQTYTLTPGPSGVNAYQDLDANGQPGTGEGPVTSVTLAQDASVPLLLGGLVSTFGARTWTLTASCATPQDGQGTVSDTLGSQGASLLITKTLTTPAQIQAGEAASYTVTVKNPNPVAVSGVTLDDPLPQNEAFVSATPAPATQSGQALHWEFGTLQPNETRTVSLNTTTLTGTPDDTLVTNTATAKSTDLPGSVQASAALRVFTTTLLLQKAVLERTADAGDLLHYTVTLSNPSGAELSAAVITDTPAAGLRYLPGSAQLDGQAMPDPAQQDGVLTFTVGNLHARQTLTLTYTLQVGPDTAEILPNTATARAIAGNTSTAPAIVNSNMARVNLPRVARLFGGLGEILGRVYVDRSGAGHYVAGTDTPVAGARVLLAGGREVLTDQQGRYHFADLQPGLYSLRLDPRSAPWAARPWPGDRGLTGSRSADVTGLTNIDFPLIPNTGGVK